jgi:hypothetical protein
MHIADWLYLSFQIPHDKTHGGNISILSEDRYREGALKAAYLSLPYNPKAR